MGAAATKAVGNVYYEARKKAAMYNDRLSSRDGAAEALGISPSTLADYELGLTKFVPVENVIRMADVYNAPQLKPHYCKNVCPIGCEMPVATEETKAARTRCTSSLAARKAHHPRPWLPIPTSALCLGGLAPAMMCRAWMVLRPAAPTARSRSSFRAWSLSPARMPLWLTSSIPCLWTLMPTP